MKSYLDIIIETLEHDVIMAAAAPGQNQEERSVTKIQKIFGIALAECLKEVSADNYQEVMASIGAALVKVLTMYGVTSAMPSTLLQHIADMAIKDSVRFQKIMVTDMPPELRILMEDEITKQKMKTKPVHK